MPFLVRLYIFAQIMQKRVLTLFLIMVMAIQMLPVMEIGKALYNSQFTEEIAHSISLDTDEVDKPDFQKTEYLPTKTFTNPVISLLASTEHMHYAVTIPHNPANDINVPPPNS
jgi:hypothetical protein